MEIIYILETDYNKKKSENKKYALLYMDAGW